MDILDVVKVKATGDQGEIIILEGNPVRKVWIDLSIPGAAQNYTWFRVFDLSDKQIRQKGGNRWIRK